MATPDSVGSSPAEGQWGADSPPGGWAADLLGEDYQYRTITLADDEEGPVRATLVRYRPAPAGPPPSRALLYLHGWSDYFFQTELAGYWHRRGAAFYALDLRKYGRSLRPWQTPGFVLSLQEYDAELNEAVRLIRAEVGGDCGMTVMAHSTGGLVASLWADRHPGVVDSLILNSPWLELRGSSVVRGAAAGVLEPFARFRPKAQLKLPEIDYYWRSISAQGQGEWQLHPLWRPRHSFAVTAGWIAAVMQGHARVARGLSLQVPVLVLSSSASTVSPTWTAEMLNTDMVLDVHLMAQRALRLSTEVTVSRLHGAMHDVLLSRSPVRARAYEAIDRWADGFL